MHQDADEVRTEGSLQGEIEAKIEAHRSQRFNAERVDALFSADPEYDTLRDIAAHGARIEVPPDVILDREPPPFREATLDASDDAEELPTLASIECMRNFRLRSRFFFPFPVSLVYAHFSSLHFTVS